MFVILAPEANRKVIDAYRAYVALISRTRVDLSTLDFVSLERFINACQAADPTATWPGLLSRRYLGTADLL